MIKKSTSPTIILLVSVVLLSIGSAHAAGVVDNIAGAYRNAATQIAANVLQYATATFWILAGIQFSGSAIRLGLQGADIQEWAAHLVRQILFIGIYAWFMQHSYEFFMDIVNSFRQAGQNSSLQPQNVFAAGLHIADEIAQMGQNSWNPFTGAFVAIASIVIVIAFVWISALIVVALCEMYILVSGSVIMMGFGGSEWTRDLANKSIMLAVSCGAKLYIMELVVSTGWQIIEQYADRTYTSNNDIFTALAAVGVFVLIVMQLPNLASQFIQGAASGSMAGEGIKAITQAAAGAALAATGVGAAAAGAMAAEGVGGSAVSGMGGALNSLGQGGGSGAGSGAGAAQLGGTGGGASGGSGGSSGGGESGGTPAARVGSALGQVGRSIAKAAAQDAYGRWTGTGIRGGTLGGRIHAYMMQNNNSPPPPPPPPPPPAGGSLS